MTALELRASGVWLALVLLSGCASHSNSAWLREPEEGMFLGARAPNLSATALPSDAPEVRPRLRHTVTLGETIAPAPEPVAAAPGEPAPPVSVTVNNYVTMPAYTPVYGSWVEPAGRAPRGESRSPGQPAGSWPSVPSYGPPFPFKSGPASPWR